MDRLKKTLLIASCVALASQLNISYFVKGFIITFSVILLPVLLYNYEDLNPVLVGFATGIISPLFRGLIVYAYIKDINTTFILVGPDVFFYFAYGLLYYLIYYNSPKKDAIRFIRAAFLCDFFSNIVEMGIRTRLVDLNPDIIKDLIIIASIRTIIVSMIIVAMKYYRSFLVKEEHESRYRKLMLLTSGFKGELYFMNKSIREIENVMKKSYKAYQYIYEGDYPTELKDISLDIAKDVHEIKKDYIRIMKGLESISRDKIDDAAMSIRDIVSILENNTKDYVKHNNADICLRFRVRADFQTEMHFYITSILSNLINNSIESMEKQKRGILDLIIYDTEKDYIFEIKDNGTGIKEGNIEYIYNPGFSTKFDEDTGNIERGLGLALVRDLIKEKFQGDLNVKSDEGKGTTFLINIPKIVFEGE